MAHRLTPPGAATAVLTTEQLNAARLRFTQLREQRTLALRKLRASLAELRRLRHETASSHRSSFPGSGRAHPVDPAALQRRFRLTRREAQVAELLAEGRSNSAVADALSVSPHTARHHTESVLVKLGAHSRAEVGAILRRL